LADPNPCHPTFLEAARPLIYQESFLSTTHLQGPHGGFIGEKSIISNIFGLMDNGIIVFDYKLDGIYNNISLVFTQSQVINTSLGDLINYDLLCQNGIYSITRVFKRDIVEYLLADFQSFLIIKKMYKFCCKKSPGFHLKEFQKS
jgi:hypothetical protein